MKSSKIRVTATAGLKAVNKICKWFLVASIALVAASAAAQNTFPASGNVGIGTTSPQSTLDVNGNINYVTLTAGTGVFAAPPGTGSYYVGSLPNAGTSVMQHLYVEVLGGSWVAQGLTRWVCNAYSGSIRCTRINDSYSPDVNDIVAYLDSSNNYDFYVSTNVSGGWPSIAISAKLFDGTNYRTVNVVSVPSPSGVQQPVSLTLGPALLPGGNIGIGTTTPGALLEVNGNVKLTQGSGASITFPDTSVQTTAWNGTLAGADYAESVKVTGDRSQYEPGDVLVVAHGARTFQKSSTPYSTTVIGIYSTKPGVLGRPSTATDAELKKQVPMAMVGIVPTKVSAENGPIEPGDLLVTSSIAGCAMKGTDRSRLTGAIVGKALGSLEAGTGLIEVAVSLQ